MLLFHEPICSSETFLICCHNTQKEVLVSSIQHSHVCEESGMLIGTIDLHVQDTY